MERKHALWSTCIGAALTIACAGPAASAESAGGDYAAYAVTKKGEKPLPEDLAPITKKRPQDLLTLRWGGYHGKHLRVGVREAENRSNVQTMTIVGPDGEVMRYEATTASENQVPVEGIDALLADALVRTGRFTVVERSDELKGVLDEQDLGASGRVAKPSAAKVGQVMGAQYLIQAVVNSYEPDVSGKSGGVGGLVSKVPVIGGFRGGSSESKVGITFKLINAETSEIEATAPVEVTISKKNLGVAALTWGGAGALGGFFEGYSKTPIGQAVIAAVNVGVFEVVKQLGNRPISGAVVKVDGDQVILNLGEEMVAVGDELRASSQGEELIDPETGAVLATQDEEIGMLRVTKVSGKISYAQPVGFDPSRLTVGDKVRSTKQVEELKFGRAW